MIKYITHVKTIVNVLVHSQSNIDQKFQTIEEKTENHFKFIDDQEEIKVPRMISHQKYCRNINNDCLQKYFCVSIATLFFIVI